MASFRKELDNNGEGHLKFVIDKGMLVKCTTFPYESFHKGMKILPDRRILNRVISHFNFEETPNKQEQ